MKERIDKLLVSHGLAVSRTKAQALVMAGVVIVNDRRVDKPSEQFDEKTVEIRIKGKSDQTRYVGRGGLKLESALKAFHICPREYVCVDIGSSTGGFTDCLLKHGAKKVYAVDAGTNQLVWPLRSDERVIVRENTNARYIQAEDFEDEIDLVTIDVSFISVTKILGAVKSILGINGQVIVLIKPQFEVGKGEVGKGGVVREAEKHRKVVDRVNSFAADNGLRSKAMIESPILGAAGNKEFLVLYEQQNR